MSRKDCAKQVPRTIEGMREYGVDVVCDDESAYAARHDEHAAILNDVESAPGRLLITCSINSPSKRVFRLCKELERVFTGSLFVKRRSRHTIAQIKDKMQEKGFTDLLVINERQREPDTLVLARVPDGPTLKMRIVKYRTSHSMRVPKDELSTGHCAEISFCNFSTSVGHLTMRCLKASLGLNPPGYLGRRIVAFHQQRDFVFLRHYRYVFGGEYVSAASDSERSSPRWTPYCPMEENKQVVVREGQEPKKIVALRELGPRMSLKLISIRKGAFDFENGEYLWLFNRHQMDKNRRQFQL